MISLIERSSESYATHATHRIFAVVNDEIITQHTIEKRLNIFLNELNIPETPAVRRRLLPHVFQMIVDENLKIQDAISSKFKVSNQDVLHSIIRRVEREEEIDYGNDSQSLLSINKVRSDLVWQEMNAHRPVQIGTSEINIALQTLRNTAKRTQNLLAEILLKVENSSQEEGTRVLAEQLVGQVHTGADFQALARQFSRTASSTQGGDIGWITQGQLTLEIENALNKMQPGEISMPIKTSLGYNIILLRERYSAHSEDHTSFTLSQLFIPLKGPKALAPRTRFNLIEATRRTDSCEAFSSLAGKTGAVQSGKLGRLRARDLRPQLRAAVLQLAPYTASAPVLIDGGMAVLMVCERTSPLQNPDIPSREAITQQLKRAKLETIRNKKLRDLRRAAFVEVRPR